MPTFSYVVKDKSGRTHTGTLESASRNALIEQLWKQDFVILSIDERSQRRTVLSSLAFAGPGKVSSDQLVIFSRQLATMVDSGIPIVQALVILSEQMEDRIFRQIVRRIRDDIEAGASLSEAVGHHPRAFTDFFVNMVRAGESSGQLDEILDRVAAYIEKVSTIQRKVKASLAYPALVATLAVVVTTALLVWIVPQFKSIFEALGGTLPLPTRLLLGVSEFLGAYLVAGVIGAGALVILAKFYLNSPAGRWMFDRTILQLPLFGKLLRKFFIARFARTLATLVKSGVPILSSLEIVSKAAGNQVVAKAVQSARASIKEGESIAGPLAKSRVFPIMVTRMIAVGEQTGELEKMLTKVADFYENEVDAAIAGLTSLIEPLVIAFLGVVVGAIAVALFLPVFQISTLVNR
jgi:type IV pilus assembly protein PilC